MIGTVYFLQQKFVESRAAALEAIKLKPNNGQAYMLIGDLYSQSGSDAPVVITYHMHTIGLLLINISELLLLILV